MFIIYAALAIVCILNVKNPQKYHIQNLFPKKKSKMGKILAFFAR
jgi:hypothetical protein